MAAQEDSNEFKAEIPDSDQDKIMDYKIRVIYHLEDNVCSGTVMEGFHEKATSIFKQEIANLSEAINGLEHEGEEVIRGAVGGLLIKKIIPWVEIEKVVFESRGHVVYDMSFPIDRADEFLKLVNSEEFKQELKAAGEAADEHIQQLGNKEVNDKVLQISKQFTVILVETLICKTEVLPLSYYYDMNYAKRGKLIIFNQIIFSENSNQKMRFGANKDEESLKLTFKEMGFDVKLHNNLTKKNLIETIQAVSKEDHSEFDCFACVVLTHGEDNGVLWAYDDTYDVKELVEPFKGCESLVGKPKIFFIQACRGDKRDEGVQIDTTPMAPEKKYIVTLPIETDFLISYATTEGYVGHRHPDQGSLYIQTLTNCLKEYKNLELLQILTIVSGKVCMVKISTVEEPKKVVYQAPSFVSRLRGFVYFSGKRGLQSQPTELFQEQRSRSLTEMEELLLKNSFEITQRRMTEDMEQNRLRAQIAYQKLEQHLQQQRCLDDSFHASN